MTPDTAWWVTVSAQPELEPDSGTPCLAPGNVYATKRDEDILRRVRESDLSLKDVAAEFGLSAVYVRRLAKGKVSSTGRRKNHVDPEIKARNDAMMVMLTDGRFNMTQVAEKYGLTRERVRQIAQRWYGHTARTLGIIERMGENKREKQKSAQERRDARREAKEKVAAKIVELRVNGYSQKEIGEALRMHQSQISAFLLAAGLRSYVRGNSPPDARKNFAVARDWEAFRSRSVDQRKEFAAEREFLARRFYESLAEYAEEPLPAWEDLKKWKRDQFKAWFRKESAK